MVSHGPLLSLSLGDQEKTCAQSHNCFCNVSHKFGGDGWKLKCCELAQHTNSHLRRYGDGGEVVTTPSLSGIKECLDDACNCI